MRIGGVGIPACIPAEASRLSAVDTTPVILPEPVALLREAMLRRRPLRLVVQCGGEVVLRRLEGE